MKMEKFKIKLRSIISLIFIFIILVWLMGMYFIWTWNNPLDITTSIDYVGFGTYGDFFGGVIGTFVSIGAVFLVYRTYKNQKHAQKEDQVESRFFELLKLHERNVEELKGLDRSIFNIYIRNTRNFVEIIKEYKEQNAKAWENKDLVKLGYLYFFYGVSEHTSEKLKGIRISADEVRELTVYLKERGIEYKGAYRDFGKYFRQLYQIVTYINEKTELNYEEKALYIKALRVRLNIEEQYLLFLNSMVGNGRDWELDKDEDNDKLITKYNLLKNIPKEYPQIEGLDFETIYPNIQYEYWEKNKSNERRRLENEYRKSVIKFN